MHISHGDATPTDAEIRASVDADWSIAVTPFGDEMVEQEVEGGGVIGIADEPAGGVGVEAGGSENVIVLNDTEEFNTSLGWWFVGVVDFPERGLLEDGGDLRLG